MIEALPQIRRAVAKDYRRVSDLIFHDTNTHRHLDWRAALEWIGAQNFWALEERGTITAALACPEDPPDVAWIRLFTHHSHLSGLEAWSALWGVACADIFSANPRAQVAAIVMKPWFQTLLCESGFEVLTNIVALELDLDLPIPVPGPGNIRIRAMQDSDMQAVERVDRNAFGGFWHNTAETLQRAREQAAYASVAEDGTGVVGFQISVGNPLGVHLARLGVRAEAQGRGVGFALLHDLIRRMRSNRIRRLSVNTQENNAASLSLYRRFGFARTGEYHPVLTYPAGRLA